MFRLFEIIYTIYCNTLSASQIHLYIISQHLLNTRVFFIFDLIMYHIAQITVEMIISTIYSFIIYICLTFFLKCVDKV